MTWQSVGTHSFVPTDKAVQVGSFDLAAGQDTIWVRITQLNNPGDWPWSYGILSWRNANGTPLGSIKAYSNRLGEVFRLGNGLPPSDGVGSIWFEPRGFNLGWLKAGFPWELQFEAQAGTSSGGQVTNYWNRDSNNKTLSPASAGDSVAVGSLSSTGVRLNAGGLIQCAGAGSGFEMEVGSQSGGSFNSLFSFNGKRLLLGASASFSLPTSGVELPVNGNSWGQFSQRSLKTDLVPITDGLNKLGTLGCFTGRYKTDSVGTTRAFLIADEVKQVLPEAVWGKGTEQDPLRLSYEAVIPLLVSALREAKTRIEALEAQAQPRHI